MISVTSQRFLIPTLVCLALMVVRVGDIHLHQCIDCTAPNVVFHHEDGGLHHHESSSIDHHQDQELPLVEEALIKPVKLVPEIMALMFVGLLLWSLVPLLQWVLQWSTLVPAESSYRPLPPPLRGPPLIIA